MVLPGTGLGKNTQTSFSSLPLGLPFGQTHPETRGHGILLVVIQVSLLGNRAAWRSGVWVWRSRQDVWDKRPRLKEQHKHSSRAEVCLLCLRSIEAAMGPYNPQLSFICRWTNCKDRWSSCMPLWTKVPSASRRCQYSSVSVSPEGARGITLQIQTAPQVPWAHGLRE